MSDHTEESGSWSRRNERASDESIVREIRLPRAPKDPSNIYAMAFRIIERFGFPTLVAIGLGAFVWQQQTRLTDAIAENTAAISKIGAALDRHLSADERRTP